jgi:hypothetical protein
VPTTTGSSGSGLSSGGTGSVASGSQGNPSTGGESLLLPGLGLLVAGGAARRRSRRDR